MADANMEDFYRRMDRIDRNHRKLARGYVTTVNADGLIVARPRTSSRRFPWRGLMLVLALMIVFKGFMYAQIGAADYDARVALLQQGTIAEQVGGYIMKADPVTVAISAWFEDMLR